MAKATSPQHKAFFDFLKPLLRQNHTSHFPCGGISKKDDIFLRQPLAIIAVPLLLTLAWCSWPRVPVSGQAVQHASRTPSRNPEAQEHADTPARPNVFVVPYTYSPHLMEVHIGANGHPDAGLEYAAALVSVWDRVTMSEFRVKICLMTRDWDTPIAAESYEALRKVLAVATSDERHTTIDIEVEVRAQLIPSLLSVAPLDSGVKPCITRFSWKGELTRLPETLRLPYLLHTPNLTTLELTNCGMALDDFCGILQHCRNLKAAEVDYITTHDPLLGATFPRKPRTLRHYHLNKLTVTAYGVDIRQLFTAIDFIKLSDLSMTLIYLGSRVDNLDIDWHRLKRFYLECWLSSETEAAIRSKLRHIAEPEQIDIRNIRHRQ